MGAAVVTHNQGVEHRIDFLRAIDLEDQIDRGRGSVGELNLDIPHAGLRQLDRVLREGGAAGGAANAARPTGAAGRAGRGGRGAAGPTRRGRGVARAASGDDGGPDGQNRTENRDRSHEKSPRGPRPQARG